MSMSKISTTMLAFIGFTVVLISAISTAAFSESSFHDNFAFSLMAVACLGLIFSIAFLMLEAVLAVCNP
ncbi:hypothetical protein [Acinetobacter tianfuensis]|uniref:Uncharacterized protein n=1 Tax=Acinetobacter tianfuensis TaxID=2419603 RepID=A0A3A8E5L0_9GAMM|nr:hypothetical protein [Acinetobacter tianfuensis]RKG29428.1 hypothetical protein D7V32_15140 [Acinetobacter tianfuensis]